MRHLRLRDGTTQDGPACAEIYAPYVTDTAISFEQAPPDDVEMGHRIVAAQRGHCWIVAQDEHNVVGYAYATEFRARPAYRFACECSVYLAPTARGQGLGTRLYEELFARLSARGFHTVFAGMTLPNAASGALHRRMGFRPVGTYREVGWKFDRWHDVAMTQKFLNSVGVA